MGFKELAVPLLIYILFGFLGIFLIPVSVPLVVVLEALNYLALLLSIYLKGRNYKVKYLLSSKKYRMQLSLWKKENGKAVENDKKLMKNAKRNFYRTGCIKPIQPLSFPTTPLEYVESLLTENGTMDKDSRYLDLMVLDELYYRMPSGGGLYSLFEYLKSWLPYSVYRDTVEKSGIISERIKNLLLDPSLETVYSYVDREQEITEEENRVLENFELKLSRFSREDEEILMDDFKKEAVKLYIKRKIDFLGQEDILSAYWKPDTERIILVRGKDSLITASSWDFVFEGNPGDELSNAGYAVPGGMNTGYYLSEEDLIHDMAAEFSGMVKII